MSRHPLNEYDQLGQVISGKKYWSDWTPVAGQQFEYAFAEIGNRTLTRAGGDSAGGSLHSATYGAYSLNNTPIEPCRAGWTLSASLMLMQP